MHLERVLLKTYLLQIHHIAVGCHHQRSNTYKWYNSRPLSVLIMRSVRTLNRLFQNSGIPNITVGGRLIFFVWLKRFLRQQVSTECEILTVLIATSILLRYDAVLFGRILPTFARQRVYPKRRYVHQSTRPVL